MKAILKTWFRPRNCSNVCIVRFSEHSRSLLNVNILNAKSIDMLFNRDDCSGVYMILTRRRKCFSNVTNFVFARGHGNILRFFFKWFYIGVFWLDDNQIWSVARFLSLHHVTIMWWYVMSQGNQNHVHLTTTTIRWLTGTITKWKS